MNESFFSFFLSEGVEEWSGWIWCCYGYKNINNGKNSFNHLIPILLKENENHMHTQFIENFRKDIFSPLIWKDFKILSSTSILCLCIASKCASKCEKEKMLHELSWLKFAWCIKLWFWGNSGYFPRWSSFFFSFSRMQKRGKQNNG